MSLRPSVFARMLNVPCNKRSAGKDGCLAKYAASAAAVAAHSALVDARRRRFPAGRCCFKAPTCASYKAKKPSACAKWSKQSAGTRCADGSKEAVLLKLPKCKET
jgi:hypothetical protein